MKPLIVANWKMNPATLAEAKALFDSVGRGVKTIKNSDIVICPPFVYLSELLATKPKLPKLGSQDCFWEEAGPFTGEISPKMLKNLGVEYVILGHSERRRWFGETEEMINKKIKAALAAGLKVIACISDAKDVRHLASNILKKRNLVVAFEPSSAISGGGPFRPCPVEEAKKMRQSLAFYPFVLYGGSVNSENARDYIERAGFQGLLIGQASLNSKEFIEIVKAIC